MKPFYKYIVYIYLNFLAVTKGTLSQACDVSCVNGVFHNNKSLTFLWVSIVFPEHSKNLNQLCFKKRPSHNKEAPLSVFSNLLCCSSGKLDLILLSG